MCLQSKKSFVVLNNKTVKPVMVFFCHTVKVDNIIQVSKVA